MIGKCKLYDIECELKKSHLIPKFAFDYMKKTGGRFLRGHENPNKRVQDGITKFLLSEKAEQEFSKRERWFANNIFFPYLENNKQLFHYNEDLSYFMVSVFWRVLLDQLEHPTSNVPELKFLNETADEWKEFLANNKHPKNFDNLNIFLTDRISNSVSNLKSSDIYLSRMIDATIVVNNDYSTVAVYVKFLRFIMWSIVKGKPTTGNNLRVSFSPSKLTLPQSIQDNYFGGFLYNRIKMIDDGPKISAEQEKKIVEEILKNEKDFFNSDMYKSLKNDNNLNEKASH
ncbi:hypothetical protein [Flavobacterium commune]|uniref:Uncharacterized protein n=1 Tax=Flavobacterium commune TaxID=1306519 RepID=A0A1D9PB28_9FLAO|nr:hypothetical protein [Flavobacterium commune]AOZ99786.1 hypothetical protein BIW12_10250 [Flavobacterium commune]